jgi:hypothetical protein
MARRKEKARPWKKAGVGEGMGISMMKPVSFGIGKRASMEAPPSAPVAPRMEKCDVCGKDAKRVVISIDPKAKFITSKSLTCRGCESEVIAYFKSYRKREVSCAISLDEFRKMKVEDVLKIAKQGKK